MRLLLPLSLPLLSHSAFAQTDERDHPIDQRVQACLDNEENYTTYGMMECFGTAYEEWDSELNRVYQLLLKELDEEAKERLRSAQHAWIEFRDAEFELLSDYYYRTLSGTMWRVETVARRVNLVRQRTKELRNYLWSPNPDDN